MAITPRCWVQDHVRGLDEVPKSLLVCTHARGGSIGTISVGIYAGGQAGAGLYLNLGGGTPGGS